MGPSRSEATEQNRPVMGSKIGTFSTFDVASRSGTLREKRSPANPQENDQIRKYQEPLHPVRSLCVKTSRRRLDK